MLNESDYYVYVYWFFADTILFVVIYCVGIHDLHMMSYSVYFNLKLAWHTRSW